MKSLLITRPEPQASELATLLRQQGCSAWVFPTIEIRPVTDTHELQQFRQAVHSQDLLIFVSQHAVNAISANTRQKQITAHTCIAIGKGTADALKTAGFTHIHYAQDILSNSEATLALPILQNVQDKTCWILRGNGGRELLPEALQQRGAHVHVVSCYERHLPKTSIKTLIDYWQQNGFDMIICTSLEGLKNLWQLLETHHALLQKTPITVLSETMLRWAHAHGIKNTRFLASANNHDIVNWIREQA